MRLFGVARAAASPSGGPQRHSQRCVPRMLRPSQRHSHIMNTIEKWLLRLLALMSLSSLAIHKITIHRAESFGARRLEAFDDAFATVVLILSAIFAVYRSVCIRRRSPRLWWRKCRRFAFWFGISIGIIPTVVIGFVKGDWTDIPDILCVAAASLLVSAAAHIRLRRMSCRP